MRHILAFAFSVILGGCIPDEKDPGQSSDIGQLNGAAYAAALGAIALQAQNAVVGDPSWFSVSNALALDLAAMASWDFRHFLIQPMDNVLAADNSRWAIDWCMQHPRWRLSVQTHKAVGIR